MKKALFNLFLVSTFLLTACSGGVTETPEIPATKVKVLDLSQKPSYQITEVGQIKAAQEIELIAKGTGTIGTLKVNVGGAVTADQVLAEIDFDVTNNPAQVNYDNTQLQLANARQTYNEIRANNQDSVTRAALRVESLETTLGRLQRNLEELLVTNKSTKTTLELQVANAEKNADTAEVNYENVIAQFDQSWIDLLKSTKTNLDTVFINLESNFALLSGLLNPRQYFYFTESQLKRGLGARNSNQKTTTVNMYNDLRSELPMYKVNYLDALPLTEDTVDTAILETRKATDEIRKFFAAVRVMLDNSITTSDLSQAELNGYYASVKPAEATIIGQMSVLDGLEQGLASFKLDRTKQIATAENGKIIANNQLADAQNALLHFQTSSVGAVQDLEAQITTTSTDLLSAQADLDSARRSLGITTSSKALEINTLENQLKLAERSLDDNKVTSSIDGVLSEFVVDEGDYVTVGTYLGKVIQHEQVKVVFYVSEETADRLTLGQTFHFTVTNAGTHDYTGIINKIAPSADSINKKIRIEGQIDNQDLFLKPEMFINLTLDISVGTFDLSKIYVPMNAIIFAQNDRYVYVVQNDAAIRKNIEIGEIYGMWVEVLKGLNKNDVLIVEGHRNLPPAGNVKINIIE